MRQNETTKTRVIANPCTRNGNRTHKFFLATIASAMMLLFACQALSLPAQIKTPLASAEITAPLSTPVSTPAPTDTKGPNATAIPPTPSVEPPAIVSSLITNAQIILTDSFTTMDRWHTYNPGSGSISNGMFVLTGQADWGSGVVFNQTLTKGFGVLIDFKTEKNADLKSQIIFNAGEYNTDFYRQFGFYTGRNPQTNLFLGKNGTGFQNLKGNLLPVANTWYSVLMAIGDNGELLTVIWNPADPAKRLVHYAKLGEKWAGQNWQFLAQADIGETLTLKDFNLLTFGTISVSNP
jgi:hypothetical protein